MIKPRTTFVLYIIVLIQVYLFLPWKGIFFILVSILFLAHLVYSSVNVCSQVYLKTLCKGKTDKKQIAITFDDGPHAEITPKVLKILDSYNAKATFFCIGENINTNPSLLKDIDSKDHLIGNHTYTHHKWFDLFSSSKMKAELENTNGLIFEIINKKTKLFRPPYGVTNPPLKKAVNALNLQTIGWSIRSLDTIRSTEKTLKEITKKLVPGDIILFHDNREHIIEILPKFLDYVKSEGFEVVNIDKLLNIKAYE